MFSILFKLFFTLIVCTASANLDDENLTVDLKHNLVNLNLKCHQYIDCYNCTLARCDWSRSYTNKKVMNCKMLVFNASD